MLKKFKLSVLVILSGVSFVHFAQGSCDDKSGLDSDRYGRKISIVEGFNESIREYTPPYLVGCQVDPGEEFSMILFWEGFYIDMGEKEEKELKLLVELMSPEQRRIIQEYFKNSYLYKLEESASMTRVPAQFKDTRDKGLIEAHLKSIGLISAE